MENAEWNSLDEFDDISTKDQYQVARAAGLSEKEALEVCARMSRDNARTPMQWSKEAFAGFTTKTPWLKVNENYKRINVASQEQDRNSVLNYYRRLLALRKSSEYKEVLTYGKFVPEYEETETIMAYYRVTEEKRMLIIANFGAEEEKVTLSYPCKKMVLSNEENWEAHESELGTVLNLKSCQTVVLECE